MYKPARSSRFEYLWDAMSFVEDNQCWSCQFKKDIADFGDHAKEYPMCPEIEEKFFAEESIPEIVDHDAAGIVCNKYRRVK